jgi:hypothetical protein
MVNLYRCQQMFPIESVFADLWMCRAKISQLLCYWIYPLDSIYKTFIEVINTFWNIEANFTSYTLKITWKLSRTGDFSPHFCYRINRYKWRCLHYLSGLLTECAINHQKEPLRHIRFGYQYLPLLTQFWTRWFMFVWSIFCQFCPLPDSPEIKLLTPNQSLYIQWLLCNIYVGYSSFPYNFSLLILIVIYIITSLDSDGLDGRGSNSRQGKIFISTVFCPVGAGGSFPGGKADRAWRWPLSSI